ncbi:hypothetical protein M3172_08685 [Mesobacillus subterraneus]|uniref:hypothetical protein n=1 Tax=Mesobacillus subterraneus TaxID=285983 RepID=UPI0020417477|nr:hypothetical protein [Mesobacillus subterraneus]MCM3573269.1 hypothetical protein [Mesobacillus subterraneus]
MKVNIYLNDNKVISMESTSFDAQDMESKLNNPKLLMLVVGDFVLNKNTIAAMGPESTSPTVEITLHNGLVLPTHIDSFNPTEIAEKMNQQAIITSIGEMVLNKNIVRMVAPLQA